MKSGASYEEKFYITTQAKIQAGNHIPVKFVYSLKPSRAVYPDKNNNLPGLKKGDVFKAQINAKQQLGSKSAVFKIYRYHNSSLNICANHCDSML